MSTLAICLALASCGEKDSENGTMEGSAQSTSENVSEEINASGNEAPQDSSGGQGSTEASDNADTGNNGEASDNSEANDSRETSDNSEAGNSAEASDSTSESPDETVTANPYAKPDSLESNEDIENARNYLWQEYLNQVKSDEVRIEEIEKHAMTFGEATMKYGLLVKGEPDENGYPLFISLHGGGQSDTPDLNNSQWAHMASYYQNSVKNGVHVNPRGVRDTWDCHFNPESYPLYDRLIENMIAFYDVDPNRVYLTGFSAGGDGVYAIVAKMPDRFAAANMSAGHPNGLPLWNLYNMPLQLQVGENDTAYDRNIVTAQYGQLLDGYQEELSGGYIHNTYIHQGKGHNFSDNSLSDQTVMADSAAWLESRDDSVMETDTNAVRFLEQHVRNPLPERVVWDLSQRADQRTSGSFYWLQADSGLTEGKIVVSYDRNTNSIHVEECSIPGEVTFLLNNDMLDLFAPITVNTPAGSDTITVTPDYDLLYETTMERGDRNYQFAAEISVTFEP